MPYTFAEILLQMGNLLSGLCDQRPFSSVLKLHNIQLETLECESCIWLFS